jgi:hypothetical protein
MSQLKLEKFHAKITPNTGQVTGYFGRVSGHDPKLAEEFSDFVDTGLDQMKEEMDGLAEELTNSPENQELKDVREQLANVRLNKKAVQEEQAKLKKLAQAAVKNGEEQDSIVTKKWSVQSKLDTILEVENDLAIRETQLSKAVQNAVFQQVEQWRQSKIAASDNRAVQLLSDLAQAYIETAYALDAEDKIQNALGTLPYFTKHIPQVQRLNLATAGKAPRSLNFDPEVEVIEQHTSKGQLTMEQAGGFFGYN